MSWKRPANWTPPTLRELVEKGLPLNIDLAAKNEAQARRELSGMTETDPRRGQAQEDILRFRSDQRHWREQLKFWGDKLHQRPDYANRPACDVLAAPPRELPPAPVAPIRPHWSEGRDRIPGEDDLEELPF